MRGRWLIIPLLVVLLGGEALGAPEASVRKVLPQLLDLKGRNALHPSLFDRDAYQAYLRKHPKEQSALRFYVQWTAKKAHRTGLALRVETRGIRAAPGEARTGEYKTLSFETPVARHGWFSDWSEVTLGGERFKTFGEVVAWRVRLLEGGRMLAEQQSFLW
jgi:hypothetical protein